MYIIVNYNNQYKHITVIYTGRFIKNQQKHTKLLQLFTSAWRNKSTERKGEKRHQDVVYTT